jgi:integrase
MRTLDYPDADGRRVVLSGSEIDRFLEEADDTEQRIAFALMARAGLRRTEALSISPRHVQEGPSGPLLAFEGAKSGWHREPPLPRDVYSTLRTYADVADINRSEPFVDVALSTVNRWVSRAAQRRQDATDTVGWSYLSPHDLRGSWAMQLIESGVAANLVMEWGGWKDYSTFRDHYLSEFSPEGIKRERQKVDWL